MPSVRRGAEVADPAVAARDAEAVAQTAAGFAASVTVPAAPQALRYRFRVACSDGGIRYLCAMAMVSLYASP